MKKIEAVIKLSKLDEVQRAFNRETSSDYQFQALRV